MRGISCRQYVELCCSLEVVSMVLASCIAQAPAVACYVHSRDAAGENSRHHTSTTDGVIKAAGRDECDLTGHRGAAMRDE